MKIITTAGLVVLMLIVIVLSINCIYEIYPVINNDVVEYSGIVQ